MGVAPVVVVLGPCGTVVGTVLVGGVVVLPGAVATVVLDAAPGMHCE